MPPKKKRVKNRKLMDSFHEMKCLACGFPGSDPAHVKTRGSGGDDIESNIIPLCRICHSYQHRIGWFRFFIKYPHVEQIVNEMGWEIVDEFGVKKLRSLSK